jgi:hypothetical protein
MWLLEVDWKTAKLENRTPRAAHERLVEVLDSAGHGGQLSGFIAPGQLGQGDTEGPATHVVYRDRGRAEADRATAYVHRLTAGAETDVRRYEDR